MRNRFGQLIAESMKNDPRIWLLTGDLGFGVLNKARSTVPNRSYNVGAAEQLMVGAAVGLTHNNKIPVCYSITPFVIFRPYEWLRNYLNHESTPVKLVGSGRDKDYSHDGISHWAHDDEQVLSALPNIVIYKPTSLDELKRIWPEFINNKQPAYLNLVRKI